MGNRNKQDRETDKIEEQAGQKDVQDRETNGTEGQTGQKGKQWEKTETEKAECKKQKKHIGQMHRKNGKKNAGEQTTKNTNTGRVHTYLDVEK